FIPRKSAIACSTGSWVRFAPCTCQPATWCKLSLITRWSRKRPREKSALPTDPLKRSIYEVQISILAERQKQEQAARDGKIIDADTKAKIDKQNQETVAAQADRILALPKEKGMEAILALQPDERRLFATIIRGAQRDRLLAELPADQREAFLAMTG